jgi:hypothetical protein
MRMKTTLLTLLGLAAILALPADPVAASPSGNAPPPALILQDWYGTSPCPTPTFLRSNRQFVDSLPFDGIAVYMRTPDGADNITLDAMSNKQLGYATIARVLSPLKGVQFTTLTQNFAAVLSGTPPDFFNDWTQIISNFADLARAAREIGLKGIYFDNENYFAKWAHYPNGVQFPAVTLKDYQDQARMRGRQMMDAMVSQFPDIVVITLHGPYLSEPKAPAPLFPQWSTTNQLIGPFFSGFVEGSGKRSTVVDGGKLYHLRTPKEFQDSYAWRKSGIVSERVDCPFIPPALRSVWAQRVSVGFGIYDKPVGDNDMIPEVLRPTVASALRQTDRYAWLCIERFSFLKPPKQGGAGEPWVNAVRQAKAEASVRVAHH